MNKFLTVVTAFLFPIFLYAQDVTTLIKEANSFESSLNEEAAFDKLKQVLRIEPRNFFALWKCSELCSRIGNRKPTTAQKQDYFKAGRIYAETAIKVNPSAADGYYALSVAMGRLAMLTGGKDRIKAVKAIKFNADKALQLNPEHGRAWHVIGKWNYEVSNLNAFEKTAVKIFYGGLPSASLDSSIKAYEKSKQLEPAFALNNLELAKAYIRNDERQKAIQLLKEMPSIPPKTEDDAQIQKEGKKLLEKIEE
jgi:tetratricopeptide (TPR) repeat protein